MTSRWCGCRQLLGTLDQLIVQNNIGSHTDTLLLIHMVMCILYQIYVMGLGTQPGGSISLIH